MKHVCLWCGTVYGSADFDKWQECMKTCADKHYATCPGCSECSDEEYYAAEEALRQERRNKARWLAESRD